MERHCEQGVHDRRVLRRGYVRRRGCRQLLSWDEFADATDNDRFRLPGLSALCCFAVLHVALEAKVLVCCFGLVRGRRGNSTSWSARTHSASFLLLGETTQNLSGTTLAGPPIEKK